MKRVVVVEGSAPSGQIHMKIPVEDGTTFGELKKKVFARVDEPLFFVCNLTDEQVFVGDRLEVVDVDMKKHEQFEKFYSEERSKWGSVPSELLLNRK